MKHWLKSMMLLSTLCAALLMVGCGEAKKEEAPAAKEAATTSSIVLNLAMDADPVSLDPMVQLSGGMMQYSHLVFDPLVRWTQDMQFEPRLAEKWERIDPKTMRFTLRKGVKFHSGNPFTAADVKYSFDRLGVSADFKGLFEPFEDVVVIDDHTIDIVTKKPYPLLLNLCTYIFPMDSKFYAGRDEIVKSAKSFANDNESGTGPFKVTKREQGVEMILERSADYWDTKTGNVEKIRLTPIKSDATRLAALLSGDVDFIMPVSPQDLDKVRQSENLDLVTMSGSRIITFQMNGDRRPEFKNTKVRQAMVYATDNDGIVQKIMKGFATTAAQQGPEGLAGYVEELKPRYDLEKAKQLMKEAGYENGFECTMIAPNNRYVNDEKIAEAFVSMMSKINIKVSLKTMPKAQYWDEFDARVADIQMIGWHPDSEDSSNYTEFLLMCPNAETGYGQYNSGQYCNAEVDQLILEAQKEVDPAKRSALLQKVERILHDEAAFIPLHWQNLAWASRNNMNTAEIVNAMNFPYFGDLVIK
ncbi:MAG: ABC transporter substrate-binding protein [Desulfovibrio sp.]